MTDWYIPPLRPLFPSALWSGPLPHIYLTFDDGPHSTATPVVLDILQRENIRSTFFLTGERAAAIPDLVRRIADSGHTIGNHGHAHRSYLRWTWGDIRKDIESAQDAISRITGRSPVLFRPPFGRLRPTLVGRVRSIGLKTVLWGVNSWDYDAAVSTERSAAMVVRRTEPGDILLFHDNEKSAGRITDYLPGLIATLRSRGFSFAQL